MSLAIIGIHGLATKPPQAVLTNQWLRCLHYNLALHAGTAAPHPSDHVFPSNKPFGSVLSVPHRFEMVYWANEIPDHLEDDADWCFGVDESIGELLEERSKDPDFHVPRSDAGGRYRKAVRKKVVKLVDITTRALCLQKAILERRLTELNLYRNDQYVATNIRRHLQEALRRAWANGERVILVGHSMGSFIAYDVLWQMSHRSDEQSPPPGRVDLFVSIGSPLANSTIRDTILADRYKKDGVRHYPTIISAWHNYAALGDVVSNDMSLEGHFHEPMFKLGALPSAEFSYKNYVGLYGPFEEPSGNINPHSAYGYLIQPKLAKWIHRIANI